MMHWTRLTIEVVAGLLLLSGSAPGGSIKWKHLSSVNGDLPVPNSGKEQTASLVCDIDKDGVNDFAIAERTQAPALVWYRRSASGWTRYIVEAGPLHIEAGSEALDIDGDGDLDIVFAGDYMSNQIWWLEIYKIYNYQAPRLDIWLNESPQ
ncbi:MAG: FG-GAP-like repeat-containing protein [Planctomycetes bacterium]|nr:FG-GAP-like repeat-containing protein [Planctomycetota bacterium]